MNRRVAQVTLLVRDYDAAIAFFVGALGFELLEDTPRGPGKRWVLVRPRNGDDGDGSDGNVALLLAKAATDAQLPRVGDQTGGRVAFFLHTDDFWRDYHAYRAAGVAFAEEPRRESYATVAVFTDCCGNRWDLLGPPTPDDT